VLDPTLAGPLGLVTEVSLLKVIFAYPEFVCKLMDFAASWCRQDVLARSRSSDIFNNKYRVSLSSYDKVRQNHRWYVQIMPGVGLIIYLLLDHIKRHTKESSKHNYTLLLVPRLSSLVSRLLEEEGVLGDITISVYNLQFIPVAEDVVSLECESAFKEIWVVSAYLLVLSH